MDKTSSPEIRLERKVQTARFVDPSGQAVEKRIEIRTHPLTGRSSRITYARSAEKEAGAEALPPPPPDAADSAACPFCPPQRDRRTPRLDPSCCGAERMVRGGSILFPNLFPYGPHSAVSLFSDRHFVEIGTETAAAYADCLINCRDYLRRVLSQDPAAVYVAVTQNHLPSAGGSLVHPHLQVHAESAPANFQRHLVARAADFHAATGQPILSALLAREQAHGVRLIGRTGSWQWLAAFAPEGFFEIWAILPGHYSLLDAADADLADLARGILNTQRFYRSLHRNGYNLGLLALETPASRLELRAVIMVRANYAPWVRNDHTGFEVMLGDMATFNAPEQTAEMARPFWV
jgi:UDPglucose--hexose-1-phosphate uridylyltransferase